MKMAKVWIPFLMIILAVTMIIGCSHMDKTGVEEVITNELNLLKNLDSDTVQKYVSYNELFPDVTDGTELSKEVEEVFSLFFKDFDYKILDINVDKDRKTASAKLKLFTIDTKALAKDFDISHLEDAILKAADSQNTEDESSDTLEERYLILNELLKNRQYDTVETSCTMELQNKDTDSEDWEIVRTHELENYLVGGLMTYLSDSDLLSPEETLAVYLNTLKTMNLDQMSNYLGVESLLNTSDAAKSSIAAALVEQVHNNFDFKITGSDIQSYKATVDAELTTFDSNAILEAYQAELEEYLASPDAVIDGSQKRYNKSLELLLKNIENNTATTSSEVSFTLVNDGVSWKLLDDGHTIGSGIFGTLTSTPVSGEGSDSSDSDSQEEEDGYDEESGDEGSYYEEDYEN
ncbi:MAG TPA: hypothetical protein IAA05_11500 [Candidatus Blautia excrementipullorum]|nr:hypothetical protein [Candidatus Blautia excrementipullorum]